MQLETPQGTTGNNIRTRPDRGERETVIDSLTTDYSSERGERKRERERGKKKKRSRKCLCEGMLAMRGCESEEHTQG